MELPLEEIEEILCSELPRKAWSDVTWWRSTPRNSWAHSWLRADRRASLDAGKERVTFTAEVYAPAFDEERMHVMHQRELDCARSVLETSPTSDHVDLRWWEPHVVYVLHIDSERLYKVGHTRHDTRRLRELTSRNRAEIVQTIELANVWAAKVVEGTVLGRTAGVRRFADRFDSRNGQTEHWDDSMPPPDLEVVAEECAVDPLLRFWSVSEFTTTQEPT
ncbi:hypothetical protein [Cryobacterium sp. SO1]|uniref:hypothetical protein n=1 Tax=Cryobacterium sp. SO1 TaxID=1897061 RepID=UPI0010230672|nr:hypothetical protein [Cryobacterium sp. SO1]